MSRDNKSLGYGFTGSDLVTTTCDEVAAFFGFDNWDGYLEGLTTLGVDILKRRGKDSQL